MGSTGDGRHFSKRIGHMLAVILHTQQRVLQPAFIKYKVVFNDKLLPVGKLHE